MSRQNKVNPGLYTQAGRLSPDDAARERGKRNVSVMSKETGRARKTERMGISNRQTAAQEAKERQQLPASRAESRPVSRSRSVKASVKKSGGATARRSKNRQTSAKSGSRSDAQKAAGSSRAYGLVDRSARKISPDQR